MKRLSSKIGSMLLALTLAVFFLALIPADLHSFRFGGDVVASAYDLGDLWDDSFGRVIKGLLLAIFELLVLFLGGISILFGWVVDPENIKDVLNNQGVYQSWTMVRDFLNLGFILVLIYSAFCTIFQIESFNWKKVLLMMIIMALLVNFSFPIARFIIDVSNIAFYYILNNGFAGVNTGDAMFAGFANFGGLDKLIAGWMKADVPVSYVIGLIVFMFIFDITLLVIAVMFVIRLVALVLLVIFSPIGFAGAAFPFSKKFASQWWDNLFKYAFFAPVMIFMLMIAFNVLKFFDQSRFGTVAARNVGAGFDPGMLANMAYFSVPIVILWAGLHAAQQMGIAGASAVTGFADKVAKGIPGYLAHAGINKFERDVLIKLPQRIGKTDAVSGLFTKWNRSAWGKSRVAKRLGLADMHPERFNLSPRAFLDGWKKRYQEIESNVLVPAAGTWRDTLNQFVDGNKTNYFETAQAGLVAAKLKELKGTSENTMYHLRQALPLIGKKSAEAQNILKAVFDLGYGNRDQNDIVNFVRENYEKPVLPGGKTFHNILGKELKDLDGLGVSGYNIGFVVNKILEASGVPMTERVKTISDLDEIAAANGGVGYGSVVEDEETGELRLAKNKYEQAYVARAKLMTLEEAQKMTMKTHHNFINNELSEDEVKAAIKMGVPESDLTNLEFAELVKTGSLAEFTAHINRHKPDMYAQVGRNEDRLKRARKVVEAMRDGKVKLWDSKLQEATTAAGTITKERADIALSYLNTLENFSKTGKNTKFGADGKPEGDKAK